MSACLVCSHPASVVADGGTSLSLSSSTATIRQRHIALLSPCRYRSPGRAPSTPVLFAFIVTDALGVCVNVIFLPHSSPGCSAASLSPRSQSQRPGQCRLGYLIGQFACRALPYSYCLVNVTAPACCHLLQHASASLPLFVTVYVYVTVPGAVNLLIR